ncbi:MAG: AAC(3) family N-acetyltransferase, partial [Victivallales bacterium]|nr:AAC(3) family N-acetyltransferase [Victivallales bacterium]
IDAFLDALGPEGTLVVPVFGALGILTATVKDRDTAIVSDHPNAKVAAIGKDAAAICAYHWEAETAHGDGTPYLKITALGGKVCLMGVDHDRNTTLHSVEALLRLPYLETLNSTRETENSEESKDFPFFPGPHRDFIGLDKYYRESGKMTIGKIGNAVVRLIKSSDLIEIGMRLGEEDPAFCLCDNPNCQACVAQRAKIAAAKFAEEDFEWAASAILAGRYVPEIVENMKNSGISKLELDYLEGEPVQNLKATKIAAAIVEFKANECDVVSLRASGVDVDMTALFEIAAENDIPNVTLPMNPRMEEQIAAAAEKKVALTFYNTIQSSDLVCALLLELKEKGVTVNFAFNAANFAACGEKPFLTSFRKKLKRFIVQVDVEDMTFTGEPTEFAQGNAEIKEVLSALRCLSFAGRFTLGARNRFFGGLRDCAESFADLIVNM